MQNSTSSSRKIVTSVNFNVELDTRDDDLDGTHDIGKEAG